MRSGRAGVVVASSVGGEGMVFVGDGILFLFRDDMGDKSSAESGAVRVAASGAGAVAGAVAVPDRPILVRAGAVRSATGGLWTDLDS